MCKNNINNNNYYKCFICTINICQKSKLNHNNNHNIIQYEQISFQIKKEGMK